jgi:methylated-DNA-[protein]-cysteine S-methyltransferase
MISRTRRSPLDEGFRYILVPSEVGDFGLVWKESAGKARVQRILLPRPGMATEDLVRAAFPDVRPGDDPAIAELVEQMRRFLLGETVALSPEWLALEHCSPFQRRVFLADYRIPRGQVTTYGLLARYLGVPGGARAVGGALAHNPFPIVIPCHRVIASDGSLGGYQGGLAMKRWLLEMEGMPFSASGRALVSRFYYDP